MGDSFFNSTFLYSTSATTSLTSNDTASLSIEEYTTFEKILIITAGTILSIMTAGGNLLVMLSFRIDKHLQIISNYFLFSLAVADLVIGLISCPFMTIYTVNQEWTLGYATCQLWLSVDYLMSNASVWNLLLISLDRYFSVTRPLTYRPKRTNKKALIMIASTYILSLILWPPWIIAWPYIEGKFAVAENSCMVQFLITNAAVTIGTIMAAFYIPVTIMVILYARVFYVTQTRQKDLKKLQGFNSSMKKKKSTVVSDQSVPSIRRESTISGIEESEESKPLQTGQATRSMSLTYQNTTAKLYRVLRCHRLCQRRRRTRKKSRSKVMEEEESVCSNSSLELTINQNSPKSSFGKASAVGIRLIEQEKEMNVLRGESNRCRRSIRQFEGSPNSKFIASRTSSERRSKASPPLVGPCNYNVFIQLPNDGEVNGKPQITLYENSYVPGVDGNLLAMPDDSAHRRRSVDSSRPTEQYISDQLGNQGEKHHSDTNITSPSGSLILNNSAGTQKKYSINVHASLLKIHKKNTKAADRKRNVEKKQEMKAAKTLSAILLAFILTWAPYSIIICIEAIFPGTTPAIWFTLSYYLCYINSTINPVLYALCNENFRRTYIRILTCKWANNRMNDNRNFSVFTR